MKYLKELAGRLIQKTKLLESVVASQKQRILHLEAKEEPSIHAMEVEHERQTHNIDEMRSSMSDADLRLDLEKQYGNTKWAKKVIDGIVTAREE